MSISQATCLQHVTKHNHKDTPERDSIGLVDLIRHADFSYCIYYRTKNNTTKTIRCTINGRNLRPPTQYTYCKMLEYTKSWQTGRSSTRMHI
ncbi:hypothetical protein E3Q12_03807 [Wallemia mellicola]|nr:hypothetical protein E3Q12_03807 [Wallemia mellicola]